MGVAGGGTNVATGARGPDVMGLGAPLLLPLVAAMYAIAATMATRAACGAGGRG
jgi:hypothetical protein